MNMLIRGAAAVLIITALGCGGEPAVDRTVATGEPVEARAAEVSLVEIPRSTRSTGSVEAWKRVSPGTKILGRVDRVLVREGDRVERGQLLAQLESRDLQAAVIQAEAAVTMAKANLENASAQYRRMTDLHQRGSVTDKNLEDATAGFRVAEAGLEQAEANLAAARVTLGYAEIRSPVTGSVVAKHAEAGDMASPGMALFVVEDLSRVRVNVQVPEAEVVGLAEGAPARVTVDVLGQELDATVDRVVLSGDPVSRTFSVRLILDNPSGAIKSGMFARVEFERGARQALLVPLSAVVNRGQLEGVFVLKPKGAEAETDAPVAQLRWIKLGRHQDGRVEVLSGLEEGERIVVEPPAALTDGATVKVVSR